MTPEMFHAFMTSDAVRTFMTFAPAIWIAIVAGWFLFTSPRF